PRARRGAWLEPRAARRRDPHLLDALWRSRHCGVQRVGWQHAPAPCVGFPRPCADPGTAAEGMDPAAARPMAGVADADADALFAATRSIAVALLRRGHRRA